MSKEKICPFCKKTFIHPRRMFCKPICAHKQHSKNKLIPITKEYLLDHIKIDSETTCWNWVGFLDKDGYGKILQGRFGTEQRTHRISYILFKEDFNRALIICHKCDNPSCINPEHLFLGTQKDNHCDMQNKGRSNYSKGEKHGRSKLKEKEVFEILDLAKDLSTSELAKKYKVHTQTIYDIKQKRRWNYLWD